MGGVNISRRNVLRSIATGTAVGAFGSGSASAREGEFNVGTSTPGATREAKRRAESVTRVLDFGEIGEAVTGRFSDADVRELRRRDDVRYVERNGRVRALGETLWWGVDRIDAEVAHNNGATGSGAHIAVLDTGIDDDHPDLNANIGGGKAFVECGSRVCGGQPCFTNNCNNSWSDDNDHGTHCAGIADAEANNGEGVVGVSTEATLHAVKVLDCNGCGSFSDVAAGIEYVADQGWDVGSLSLGADSGSQTLKDACGYAYNNGVLLVAAAGNSGPCTDCVGYPAAYSEVVAVSATGKNDALADYSSTGPEVELAAPGGSDLDDDGSYEDSEVIKSSVIGGYDYFAGTSMACPHVSGVGGMLMVNGYTNTEARSQLTSTAEDIGLSSSEQGAGLVDAAAALGYDSSDDLGGSNSSPAVDSLSASEVETSDSDAEFDVDWSVSDSDGNLDTVDLTLTDDTDGETEDTASISVSGDTASATTRLVAAGDDGSGNSYTVEAVVTDTDGASDSATTSVSESEDTGGGNAPAVDGLSLSEDNHGGSPHADFDASWSVSDSDGDLDTVDLTLTDLDDGETEDSVSVDVSGSDASGTTGLSAKHEENSGHEYEVELVVTDSNGNTASATATEIEDGS